MTDEARIEAAKAVFKEKWMKLGWNGLSSAFEAAIAAYLAAGESVEPVDIDVKLRLHRDGRFLDEIGQEWDQIAAHPPVPEPTREVVSLAPCKYGDPLCPCQDGDQCHYEGHPNPMKPPSMGPSNVSHEPVSTRLGAEQDRAASDEPSSQGRGHEARNGNRGATIAGNVDLEHRAAENPVPLTAVQQSIRDGTFRVRSVEPTQPAKEPKMSKLQSDLKRLLDYEPKPAGDDPNLCDDEGCPHFGTPHVCISRPAGDDTQTTDMLLKNIQHAADLLAARDRRIEALTAERDRYRDGLNMAISRLAGLKKQVQAAIAAQKEKD